jgi:hypothetical protein
MVTSLRRAERDCWPVSDQQNIAVIEHGRVPERGFCRARLLFVEELEHL